MHKDFEILGKYKGIEILYEYDTIQGTPQYVTFISKGEYFKPTGFSIQDFDEVTIPNILDDIPDWISLMQVRIDTVVDIIEDVGKLKGAYSNITIYKKIIDKIYERKNNTITNF